MVIGNVKLRELVAKGPKYQEPNKINWKSTKLWFETLLISMRSRCKREQVDLKYFSEWKDQIKELVVKHKENKKQFDHQKQKTLNDADMKDTLN